VKDFAGRRVGIDAYSWLHKGAHSCAKDLCTGQPTDRYVRYFQNRLEMLKHHEVIPVVVFDGDRLPLKATEESERQRRRKEYLAKGKSALAACKHDEAEEAFRRAIEVTPQMAFSVIQLCDQMNIEFIVAPYEADAQLAYMSLQGDIDAVISEDSDLFVYGVSKLLLKVDKFGEGDLLDSNKLPALRDPDFTYFTRDMIVYMCVLAGCDFFPGIRGVGVRTAHTTVRRYKSAERLLQLFRHSSKYKEIPPNFEAHFRRACMVFSHQRVFDKSSKKIVHLRELGQPDMLELVGEGSLDFLGPVLPDDVALAIATGKIDPLTKEAFQVCALKAKEDESVESSSFVSEQRRLTTCVVRNIPNGRRLKSVPMKSMEQFIERKRPGELSLAAPFRAPRKVSKLMATSESKVKVTNFFKPKSQSTQLVVNDRPRAEECPGAEECPEAEKSDECVVENITQSQNSASDVYSSPFFSREGSDRVTIPANRSVMDLIENMRHERSRSETGG